jgi:hypothetical protein
MLSNTVFKRLHYILTSILLIIVAVGGVVFYSEHSSPDDILFSKKQLTPDTWHYITKYHDGGATVGEVYRYYLNKHLDKPLPVLSDSAPFLVSDRSNAMINAVGDRILVRFTGKIYSFSNSASFYDGNMPIMPLIDFNSTATGRYGS